MPLLELLHLRMCFAISYSKGLLYRSNLLAAGMATPGLLLFGEFEAIQTLWKSIGGSAAASSSTLRNQLPGSVPHELMLPRTSQRPLYPKDYNGLAVFTEFEFEIGAVS